MIEVVARLRKWIRIIGPLLVVIGLFLVASNLSQAYQTLRGCPPMPSGASDAFCQNWAAVQTFASGVIIVIVGVALIVIVIPEAYRRAKEYS